VSYREGEPAGSPSRRDPTSMAAANPHTHPCPTKLRKCHIEMQTGNCTMYALKTTPCIRVAGRRRIRQIIYSLTNRSSARTILKCDAGKPGISGGKKAPFSEVPFGHRRDKDHRNERHGSSDSAPNASSRTAKLHGTEQLRRRACICVIRSDCTHSHALLIS